MSSAGGVGAFYSYEDGVEESRQSYSTSSRPLQRLTFDASRVARTSSETRSSNTALAPRIIAY